MIDVIVVGDIELIGEDEVVISIDGTEDEEELKNLIEDELENTLDDDVASTLMLEPECRDTWGFVGISESLSDDEFMEKIALCDYLENCSGSYWDLLDLCRDLGLYHVDDFDEHYIGHYLSTQHFCKYYLEDELSQVPYYIEDSIDWDVLVENLSEDVYVYGDQYARVP